jgi:hypothetical protein
MNVLARIAVLGTLPLVFLATGCNSQSEGQRCDQPADCESDLACVSFTAVPLYGVCCPTTRASTVASCNPGVSPTMDAAVPDTGPEASADDDAAPDGGGEVDGAPEDAGAE